MDVKENKEAKVALVVASLICGIFVGISTRRVFLGIIIGILASLAYPFVGAFVIWLCERLKSWAYMNQCEKWEQEVRLAMAGVWPFTLIGCLIIYIFLGIIHRIF